MDDLLLQIILARRNDDAESWMNILFVVVLAVVWAIGGIIKAKANKSETRSEDNLSRKPARKPPVHSREAREQMLKRLQRPAGSAQGQHQLPRPTAQKPRMKFADLRAAARKLATEVEQATQPQAIKTIPEQELQLPKPQIQPEIQASSSTRGPGPTLSVAALPKFTGNGIKGLEDKQVPVPLKVPEVEYLSELLLDYADPEELRRAILHYEILGRPLSLRDSSEHLIGL